MYVIIQQYPAITKVCDIQNIIHNKGSDSSWSIFPNWWPMQKWTLLIIFKYGEIRATYFTLTHSALLHPV